MFPSHDRGEAWVQYLKSQVAITGLLDDPNEIRESSWKGEIFTYPNIRVRAINVLPHINPECAQTMGNVAIEVFSEEKSSKQADEIAGTIANFIHGKKFTSSGIKFWATTVTDLVAAVAESDTVWRAEIRLNALMS